MKYVFYAIDKTIAHSNDLLICFCLTLLKKMLKVYQDNSSTYVNHGKISITDDWLCQKCQKTRLLIANILSGISKNCPQIPRKRTTLKD